MAGPGKHQPIRKLVMRRMVARVFEARARPSTARSPALATELGACGPKKVHPAAGTPPWGRLAGDGGVGVNMKALGCGLNVMQARRNRRMSISLKRPASQHLKLVLTTQRNLLTPVIDRRATNAKGLSQRSLAAKKADGFGSGHSAQSLAWHTPPVNHSIQDGYYLEGMPTTTINDRINARLDELEKEGRKITDAALGRIAGVARQTVGDWRKGRSVNLRPENLIAVADALGLEVRWLATGRGPRLARHPMQNYTEAHELIDQARPETVEAVTILLKNTTPPPPPPPPRIAPDQAPVRRLPAPNPTKPA